MNNDIIKEKYGRFFTKEYMMGPSSLRLLDELLCRCPEACGKGRLLDLGCGEALSSIFVAGETEAELVFATDLWISATDNMKRIVENGLEARIIPIHADALALPFADDFFDTIVSVDAYHYFGCADGIFAEKILPLVKPGGHILICIPGLHCEPQGEMKSLMHEWAEDDESMFHTVEWWKEHLEKDCAVKVEIKAYESNCFDEAWNDWYATGHEYAERDKEFLCKGLGSVLNFVMLDVKRIG